MSRSRTTTDAKAVPEYGVRNRSFYASTIHRQHPDADEPRPACREGQFQDAEYKQAHIPTLCEFNSWGLCRNPRCFPDKLLADGGFDRYIRFADRHVEPILEGEKRLTTRLDFERDLKFGDEIDLIDDGGERFATATVEWIGYMSALRFVAGDHGGHRSYRSVSEFLDELREYYPDAQLYPGIRITVIRFGEVTPMPEQKRALTDGRGSQPIPNEHPLADAGALKTHEDHLRALGQYLERVDPEHLESLMVVTATPDGIDTVPTLSPEADIEDTTMLQLAAHISHVCQTFDIEPWHAASHAVELLGDAPAAEVYSDDK